MSVIIPLFPNKHVKLHSHLLRKLPDRCRLLQRLVSTLHDTPESSLELKLAQIHQHRLLLLQTDHRKESSEIRHIATRLSLRSSPRERNSQVLPIPRETERALIRVQQHSNHISRTANLSIRLALRVAVPLPSTRHICVSCLHQAYRRPSCPRCRRRHSPPSRRSHGRVRSTPPAPVLPSARRSRSSSCPSPPPRRPAAPKGTATPLRFILHLLAHPSRSRRPAASPPRSAAAVATQTPLRYSTPRRATPTSSRSSSSSSREDRSPSPPAATASSSVASPLASAPDPPPPPSSRRPPCFRSSHNPRSWLELSRYSYASFSFSFFRRSCSRRKASRPSPVSSSSPCAKSHWSRRGQPQCLSALGGTACQETNEETFPLVSFPPPLAHLLLLLLAQELAARTLHAFRPMSKRERETTNRERRSTSRTRLPSERPFPRRR